MALKLNTDRAGTIAYLVGCGTKVEIVGDYDAAIYSDGTAPYVRVKMLEAYGCHLVGDVVDYGAEWVR